MLLLLLLTFNYLIVKYFDNSIHTLSRFFLFFFLVVGSFILIRTSIVFYFIFLVMSSYILIYMVFFIFYF